MDADRDILNAFMDGELSPKQMEEVAALLESRPDLEQYVRDQERLRTALKMESVLRAPVPQRLVDSIYSSPVSRRWRLWAQLRCQPGKWSLAAAATALAVGLVVGIAIRPAGDLIQSHGQLLAAGPLRQDLDHKLASAGYDGRGARIGISFRDRSGADCRTFTDRNMTGLACHHSGSWVVTTLVAQAPQAEGPYRMAGSEMPDAIRRAVEATIAGEPYDAAQEAQARASGWRGQ
jgi:anti-sigma factor RsiW